MTGAGPSTSWRELLAVRGRKDDDLVARLYKRFERLELDRSDLGVHAGPRRRTEPGHCWVPYKEAFSPQLVHEILDSWPDLEGPLLDPFAGVGTSLLVAAERGLSSIGVELLPYPRWAANTVLSARGVDPDSSRV